VAQGYGWSRSPGDYPVANQVSRRIGVLSFTSGQSRGLTLFFSTRLNKIAYLLLSIAIILAIIVVASTAFVDIDPSIATVSSQSSEDFPEYIAHLAFHLIVRCRDRRFHFACFLDRRRVVDPGYCQS
jgi:hypothetical protein